jgi:NADH-quinone oxidoreductase subunit C
MADDTAPAATEAAVDDAVSTPAEPERLHGALVTSSRGQAVVHTDAAGYVELIRALHDDGYLMCVDLTAVDYLTYGVERDVPAGVEPERFEVVVSLLSHSRRERVRVRVQVPEGDPTLPSITDLHPGADAMEREAFDMFGVTFTGHPDLTRILMPEDWVGHPLRKDYNSGRIPVQFKRPASAPESAGLS